MENNKTLEKAPFKERWENFKKAYFEWARYNPRTQTDKAVTLKMAENRVRPIIEKKAKEVQNYYAYGANTTIHYEARKELIKLKREKYKIEKAKRKELRGQMIKRFLEVI